jgi:hypothetical protein
VARSFIVYQGEDETPEFDLTDPDSNVHVIFEEVEAGGRAYRGESNSSTIPMRDERGETGNEAELPVGLTHVSLSRGSRWVWMDGPDGDEVIMATGRIGAKSYSRGRQKADRAREVIVEAADRNEELTDIIVDDWVRPEEQDYERVQALLDDYLTGSPRATTTIANTYLSVANGVTVPAKTYDGTDPKGVLDEIATFANKNYFVTVDDELWYDAYDSTTYPAGIRISDRPDEWNMEGSCSEGVGGSLGAAWTNDPDNYPAGVVTGPNVERVALTLASSVAAGMSIVALVCQVKDADTACGMYDDAGNTWTLAAEFRKPIAGHQPRTLIYFTNVTNALSAGDNLYFEVDCGASVLASLEEGYKAISAYAFDLVLSSPAESGNAQSFGSSPSVTVGSGDLIVAALGMKTGSSGAPDTVTPDAAWTAFAETASPSHSGAVQLLGGFRVADADGQTWSGTIDQSRDWAMVGATFDTAPAGSDVLTFPPKWDVGDSSREDGLELVSGLRLYYGQDGAYVTASDAVTEAEYWHAERSFYTSDPAINDATKAGVMAEAILQRLKFEDRTYNVSIGPLSSEQVGCIKYGQLINIKARAIPDADDQFVPRRIAQLRWTTPRPGVFWARMQLDRPLKEVPYGVGPKQGHDALELHKEGDSHPASAIVITDAGGYFTGNDVEAALQELGSGGVGSGLVIDHGTMGAAETFDASAGHDHEGVQDANLTVTLTGATSGEAAWMTLVLTQDGGGGNTINLPSSVVNEAEIEAAWDTTASAVNILTLFSYDGGTTWYGALLGGGGSSVGALDDLSDVTITSVATADRLRYDGSEWVNSSLKWVPVTTFDGTNWLPAVDGDGNAIVTET